MVQFALELVTQEAEDVIQLFASISVPTSALFLAEQLVAEPYTWTPRFDVAARRQSNVDFIRFCKNHQEGVAALPPPPPPTPAAAPMYMWFTVSQLALAVCAMIQDLMALAPGPWPLVLPLPPKFEMLHRPQLELHISGCRL